MDPGSWHSCCAAEVANAPPQFHDDTGQRGSFLAAVQSLGTP
jgi:hypothetical protein